MTEEQPLPGRRKKRDRARTEADLLSAAQRLFDRDGVLAGLNLNEVATEAGVNRGQIYQMYGNRRQLLRAALARALDAVRAVRPNHFDDNFASRKRAMMPFSIAHRGVIRTQALLALDGDEEFHVFPAYAEQRAAFERDKATGALPADVDAEALHTLLAAACAGYAVLREAAARDTEIPLPELDQRVTATYNSVIDAMTTRT